MRNEAIYSRQTSDSDVYVFFDQQRDRYLCGRCKLVPEAGDYATETAWEMADHLLEHLCVDHRVPERVIFRLRSESD